MSAEDASNEVQRITPTARGWIWASACAVSLVIAAVTLIISRDLHRNKLEAKERHRDWFDQTESDKLPAGAEPTKLATGVYVDRIPSLSVKEVNWQVDFYVWFRWQGDRLKIGDDFHDSFRVVNGWATEAKLDARVDQGGEHYVRFRVLAQISKFFDLRRFPLDNHLLTLNLEHRSLPRHELLLVPDLPNCGLSSRVRIT